MLDSLCLFVYVLFVDSLYLFPMVPVQVTYQCIISMSCLWYWNNALWCPPGTGTS